MGNLGLNGQTASQVANHFLHLLDDVYRIHGLYLEEIQALKAHVKELEAANSTLSSTFLPDVHGCAVYLVSMDGTIQGWSGGAAELYGYSVEEVLGQSVDFLKNGAEARTRARFAWSEGRPPAFLRAHKDGRTFEVILHHTVLLDEDGCATGRMYVEVPLWCEGKASGDSGGRS